MGAVATAGTNGNVGRLKSERRCEESSSLSQVVKAVGPDIGVAKAPNGPQTGQTLQQRRNLATPQKAQQTAMTRQLPDGVDELSILRQISNGLKLKSGRLQRAQIRLNPEELGTVDIKMQMKGDSVRVSVTTEHPGVVDVLSSGLDQLKRNFGTGPACRAYRSK